MTNNYPSDPKNVSPVSHSAAQSDLIGSAPETPHTPSSSSIGQVTPSSAQNSSAGGSSSGPRRLASGTELSNGRYRIEALVASGGMGAVYRSIDTRFNRPCAVKEMLDEFSNESERAQAVEWFSREATLLLELNHSCIPRVRDFFAESGRNYLVMDFIDGRTLAEVMEREGTVQGVNGARGITEERARSWTRQICSVLTYLHHLSPPVIFRDLKPSNVMVTTRDEIKLIDFGIARTFQSQRQATVIMTLGYAPPEQLHGMPEPRSDLYALGATIFRVLTRHDAVNNKPNIFAFPPLRSLRPDITPAFEQILMKALAPNIEQRWSSADEMERAIVNLPPLQPGATPRVSQSGIYSSPQTPVVTGGAGNLPSAPFTSGPPPTHTTTGLAGTYITAALDHLNANPQRLDDAYNAVMAAHGLEPNNSLVHKCFGQVFARRTPVDVDNAIRAYRRSLELYNEDAETHKLLGDIWLYLRPNYIQAIPAYVQSIRLNPNDFETHERLATCYEKTGQLDPAIRAYQEALRLAGATVPPQPKLVMLRLNYALGQVARRANQFALAEHAFVQVLILNPADHSSRFLLAQVYEQEGKFEEAFRECSYVLLPLGATNQMVHQVYNRLRMRLGR